MKFGQDMPLGPISLKLPELRHLNAPAKSSALEVYLGGPVWGCVGWKGTLYPENAKPKDFLHHYANSLGAIELNATLYGIPPDERIRQWREQTTDGFIFCPKFPRHISNARDKIAQKERMEHYWRSFQQLGPKLGPSFYQFSDKQGLEILYDLESLTPLTPKGLKVAVEFRYPDFFENNELVDDVASFLKHHNYLSVISDTIGRREVLHQTFVGDTGFVRFLGENGEERDQERLEIWLERIVELQQSGLKKLFFFIHQPDETNAAHYFEWFASVLNSMKNVSTRPVALHNKVEQVELF